MAGSRIAVSAVATMGDALFYALLMCFLVVSLPTAVAQLTTFAGGGTFSPARGALVNDAGLYFADPVNHVVRMFNLSSGILTTVVGAIGVSGDAIGPSARLKNPEGVCHDGADTLVIVDTGNNKLKKLELSTGIVSAHAGASYSSGSSATDSLLATARFKAPKDCVFLSRADDASLPGDLFVADAGNNKIRVVNATNVAAFTGGASVAVAAGDADGRLTMASFQDPSGLCADTATGTLFVADTGNGKVRRIAVRERTPIVSSRGAPPGLFPSVGDADGIDVVQRFTAPTDCVAAGVADEVFVVDKGVHRIRRSGRLASSTVVGSFAGPGDRDAVTSGLDARLWSPVGIVGQYATQRGDGRPFALYVLEAGGRKIRSVSLLASGAAAAVTTVVGTNSSAAAFRQFTRCCRQSNVLYCVDASNHVVRKIAFGGANASVFLGVAGAAGTVDSATDPTKVRFDAPIAIACDGLNLWIAEATSGRIRKVAATTQTTVTLTSVTCSSATAIAYAGPTALFVACDGGKSVVRVDPTANSGTGSSVEFAGSIASTPLSAYDASVDAKTAPLTSVLGLCVARHGASYDTLVMMDAGSHRIVVAGISSTSFVGEGQAMLYAGVPNVAGDVYTGGASSSGLRFNGPSACAVDREAGGDAPASTLWVADTGNNKIKKLAWAAVPASRVMTAADVFGPATPGVTTSGDVTHPTTPSATRWNAPNFIVPNSNAGGGASFAATSAATSFVVGDSSGRLKFISADTSAVTDGSPQLKEPVGFTQCCRHPNGVFYCTDTANHVIRRVSRNQYQSVFAGAVGEAGSQSGTAGGARFNSPYGIACDGVRLWVTDAGNDKIRRIIVATGVVTDVSGTCTAGTGIAYGGPKGTSSGTVIYAACQLASNQYKIVKLDNGAASPVLADHAFYASGATAANPAFDSDGQTSAADAPLVPGTASGIIYGLCVGKTSTDGGSTGYDTLFFTLGHALGYITLSTDAGALGDGTAGKNGLFAGSVASDGAGDDTDASDNTKKPFRSTRACAANLEGTASGSTDIAAAVFIAETGAAGHRVSRIVYHKTAANRAVTRTGATASYAAGSAVGSADGTRLRMPLGVARDGALTGSTDLFLVMDSGNQALKALDVSGNALSSTSSLTTPAATVSYTQCCRHNSSVFFCTDMANHVIRKVVRGQYQVVFAGALGDAGIVDDSVAASRFNAPYGIACDGSSLWVTDGGNNRIREIDLTITPPVVNSVKTACTAGAGIAVSRRTASSVVVYAACETSVANQHKIIKFDAKGLSFSNFAFHGTGTPADPTFATDSVGGGVNSVNGGTTAPLVAGLERGVILGMCIGKTSSLSTLGYDTLFFTLGDAVGFVTLTNEAGALGNPAASLGAVAKAGLYAGVVSGTPGDGSNPDAGGGTGVLRQATGCAVDLEGVAKAQTAAMAAIYVTENGPQGHRVARITFNADPGSRSVTRTGAASNNVAGDVVGDAATARLFSPSAVTPEAPIGTVATTFLIVDAGNQKLKLLRTSGETISAVDPYSTPGSAADGGAFSYSNAADVPPVAALATTAVAGATSVLGDATQALFSKPAAAVQVGSALFIADAGNHVIRRVQLDVNGSAASVTVAAGAVGVAGDALWLGGAENVARFNRPTALTAAPSESGNLVLYVADTDNHKIKKITLAGGAADVLRVELVAGPREGIVEAGDAICDGNAEDARFQHPSGLALIGGSLFVADTGNHKIKRIDVVDLQPRGGGGAAAATYVSIAFGPPAGTVSAGNVDSTTPSRCRFFRPMGLAYNRTGGSVAGERNDSGAILVADSQNHRIRQCNLASSSLSSNAAAGCVTIVGPPSTIATFASAGVVDGADLSAARLRGPVALSFDQVGNLFIVDAGNHLIRRLSTASRLSTVAGSVRGFAEQAAPSTGGNVSYAAARFDTPSDIVFVRDGLEHPLVVDTGNHRLRQLRNVGQRYPTTTTVTRTATNTTTVTATATLNATNTSTVTTTARPIVTTLPPRILVAITLTLDGNWAAFFDASGVKGSLKVALDCTIKRDVAGALSGAGVSDTDIAIANYTQGSLIVPMNVSTADVLSAAVVSQGASRLNASSLSGTAAFFTGNGGTGTFGVLRVAAVAATSGLTGTTTVAPRFDGGTTSAGVAALLVVGFLISAQVLLCVV